MDLNVENIIQDIKRKLNEQGYSGKFIIYEELQELYRIHGKQMGEKNFALHVLNISYDSYLNAKNKNRRVRILNEERIIDPKKIEAIQKELMKKRYKKKLITYKEFKELYKEYEQEIEEKDFAIKVLKLKNNQYMNIKNNNGRTRIFNDKINYVDSDKINEIKEKLKKLGYEKKVIDYKEFKILYKKYGEKMLEGYFAENILELPYANFFSMKNRGTRAKILKGKENNIDIEEIEKIKMQLKKLGYSEKPITYEELQELNRIYGQGMSERNFAFNILELSYANFMNMKNKNQRGIILNKKDNAPNPKKIKEIKEQLRNCGYAEKKITYEELQELNKKFGKEISEDYFAVNILELPVTTYGNMKNNGKKGKILNKELMDENEINEIKEKLRKMEYEGKAIAYEELQELHKEFGLNMKEKNFAIYVLELTQVNYYNIKCLNTRGKILKVKESNKKSNKESNKEKIKEEEKFIDLKKIEEIKGILKEMGYEGKSITYEELQELHMNFGQDMNEKDFAIKVLELTQSNFDNIKYGKLRGRILYYSSKIDIISNMFLNESRYYTKEEINNLCEINNISIDRFILQIFKSKYFINDYKNVIESGKIWIGKVKLSNSFVEKNYDKMMKLANIAIYALKNKYGKECIEDEDNLKQEAILYVIQNRGNIEKIFSDEQKINKYMYISMKRFMQYTLLRENKIKLKTVSLHEKYTLKDSEKELQDSIKSEFDTEQEVLKMLDDQDEYNLEEVCIKELRKQIENGATREQALSNTSKKLKLEKDEMLKMLQNYLLKKKNIVITNDEVPKQDVER